MTEMLPDSFFPPEDAIPQEYRISSPLEQKEYLCDGEIKTWTGASQDVLSPICDSSGKEVKQIRIGSYPLLGEEQALEALDSACRAYDNGRGSWPAMSVEQRIQHVNSFICRMQEMRDEVVRLLMWEIGKTSSDAGREFDRTVDYIRETVFSLKELDRVSSRFVMEEGVIGQIRRAPLGVVLCMGPYNYPLNETFTTLIPALIMGNTIIFKPPRMGVLLHQPFLEAFRLCFPKGVVNTVYGDGQTVISPLMHSGKIDVLAFIGSSRVADILKSQHPKPHRLRCILGLEAKNAGIVLRDADIDLAVMECLLGSLSFNGQRCTALKILFVHKDIKEEFLTKFSAAVSSLIGGMPWEEGVKITPLPEPGKTDYLKELIADAVAEGASVMNAGGGIVNGTFMSPAVVYPVKKGMRLFTEEQFGPVVPVAEFSDVKEPLNYITESDYGQQVSLFGSSPDEIACLVDLLVSQVSRVNLNSQCQRGPDTFPFTGRKDSAEGTLSVTDALKVFTIRTLFAAKENGENKRIIRSILTERKSTFISTDYIL